MTDQHMTFVVSPPFLPLSLSAATSQACLIEIGGQLLKYKVKGKVSGGGTQLDTYVYDCKLHTRPSLLFQQSIYMDGDDPDFGGQVLVERSGAYELVDSRLLTPDL
eukprot:sb/3477811/